MRMGPWPGGVALRDFVPAPYNVPPGELRFLQNMDVGDSGALSARPGCRRCGSATMYTDLSSSGLFTLLGSVDETSALRYAVIATHNAGTPGTTTVYYTKKPHDSTAFSVAPGGTLSGIYTTLFQYNTLLYFVGAVTNGGTGQSRTAIGSGSWTAVATLPKGELSFVVRERVFIVDKMANRIYWSKATDPTVWAAPDGGFVDINPGDGQLINDVVVLNSQLYIFKRNKTYLFTFSTDPAIDGQLTLISSLIGAYSATPWTGGIYLVNDRSVYRLTNTNFTDLAVQVDLRGNMALEYIPGVLVNLEADRLVVGPAPSFTTVFTHAAMNLHTGAWSLRSYQKADGTFFSGAAPSTKQTQWRDTDTSINLGGSGVMYGHNTRVLSYTWTNYAFSDGRLDLDDGSTTVSPQYALITAPSTAGSYDTWKHMHSVYPRVGNTLSGGDNAVALEVRPAPALTAVQSVAVPTVGGKTPVRGFRFRALSVALNKPIKNLGALDPVTTGNLFVWEMLCRASSHGRAVNTS